MGSCRREILDPVIALNEQHLCRLVREYVSYHHEDRIHDSLEKDTPNRRLVERKRSPEAAVISHARRGGLHHRYAWRQAAWNLTATTSLLCSRRQNHRLCAPGHGAGGAVSSNGPVADACPNRCCDYLSNCASASVHTPLWIGIHTLNHRYIARPNAADSVLATHRSKSASISAGVRLSPCFAHHLGAYTVFRTWWRDVLAKACLWVFPNRDWSRRHHR